jgi:quercetin dioxygenase-like cupin family protein
VLEDPRTGQTVAFVAEAPDLLVMENVWTRPGDRSARHAHPGMEERWEVLAGRAAFAIGDAEPVELGPGESIVAPPGVPHVAWNPTGGEVRLRIEMRPALRWRAFVERLFAGDDPVALLREFPDEIAPAG